MESKGKNSFVKNIYTKFHENPTIDSSLLVCKYRRTDVVWTHVLPLFTS